LCTHFVSAICRLNCRDLFGAFVSAPLNRVSRRRRLALAETRFECCASGRESEHLALLRPLSRQVCETGNTHAAKLEPILEFMERERIQ
jgi:hypothetical protein